ncbi:MAG: hypothetical protein KDC67_15620 [Ignavibacteriae bacterium]|nr:hypothetical protein [Ignavibacteriota bacterium]
MNSKLYMAKIIVLLLISITTSKAQFLDEFNKDKIDGWFAMVGDGTPEMRIISQKDYATIFIDGTKDKYNVY